MSRDVLLFLVGEEATLRLCQSIGGADLRVPVTEAGEGFGRLAAVIGTESARTLVERVGGSVLYVPHNEEEMRRERDDRVRAMVAQGMTPAQVAREFTYTAKLTERQVYRILSRAGETEEATDTRQPRRRARQ